MGNKLILSKSSLNFKMYEKLKELFTVIDNATDTMEEDKYTYHPYTALCSELNKIKELIKECEQDYNLK